MKSLRRFDLRDAYYFVTVVTYRRRKFLTKHVEIFWKSWKGKKLFAWVILPDHFHAIVKVDDISISDIIHNLKIQYYHRISGGTRQRKIWQNRFWDHIIRDEKDMNNHLDYIHYNPVKHGIVNDPFEYHLSSLGGFLNQGLYERGWGVGESLHFEGEYGE
jgi:putative transposase